MKSIYRYLLASALVCLLTGCALVPKTPAATTATEAPTTQPQVTEIAQIVTEDTIGQLEEYPQLQKADLTGSTCYEAIEAYCLSHPEVEVTYTVDLGGTQAAADTAELILPAGSFQFAMLQTNLQYLKQVTDVVFPETELTAQELDALQSQYPELTLSYSLLFGDNAVYNDARSVDLSFLDEEGLTAAYPRLAMLPELTSVNLLDEEGSNIHSLALISEIQEALPNTTLHCRFDLFGKTVSTEEEEIIYSSQYIGNRIEDAPQQLRQALSVLKNCKRFVLDNCHFENEVLAEIREEFRDTTKLVWRVWFGGDGSCLTDREIIRYMPTLTGDNSHDLIYCEDARFIDVGHNEALFNVNFVSKMSKLEAIIISGSPVSDMTPFAGCESLKFLELAYCMYVTDISAVANCTNLERINIAYTSVSDLSPLDDRNLVAMVDTHSKVPAEELERFTQLHPETLLCHTGDQPYGYPWRYNEDRTPNDYYAMLRVIFDYDHPAQTRW